MGAGDWSEHRKEARGGRAISFAVWARPLEQAVQESQPIGHLRFMPIFFLRVTAPNSLDMRVFRLPVRGQIAFTRTPLRAGLRRRGDAA